MKIATIIIRTKTRTDFLQEVICIQAIRLRKFYTNSQKIDSVEDFSLDLFLDLHLDLIRLKKMKVIQFYCLMMYFYLILLVAEDFHSILENKLQ